MAAEMKAGSESERMAICETRMETYVTREQTEMICVDIKENLADIRADIRSLKWQFGVIVAVLSTVISFLVSRIPT